MFNNHSCVLRNAKLLKCQVYNQVDEMSSRQNVKLTECQVYNKVDEKSSRQNVKFTKCQVVALSS